MMVNVSKKKVEVVICGQRLSLRSDRDEAHVHKIAQHVSQEVEVLRKHMRSTSTQNLLLLVALNLAEELEQQREKIALLSKELNLKTQRAIEQIDRTLATLPSPAEQNSSPL